MMVKFGYSDALATGAIAAGGTLGILIPPSTIMVIYGIMTGTSIGKLFAAGIIPGILVGTVLLGDALNGYVDNGHYFLYSKFHRPHVYVEVSRALYTYSWWHGLSAFASILIAAVSAAMLSDDPPTVAGLKADLKEFPRALSPMRLGIFARALWDAAGS